MNRGDWTSPVAYDPADLPGFLARVESEIVAPVRLRLARRRGAIRWLLMGHALSCGLAAGAPWLAALSLGQAPVIGTAAAVAAPVCVGLAAYGLMLAFREDWRAAQVARRWVVEHELVEKRGSAVHQLRTEHLSESDAGYARFGQVLTASVRTAQKLAAAHFKADKDLRDDDGLAWMMLMAGAVTAAIGALVGAMLVGARDGVMVAEALAPAGITTLATALVLGSSRAGARQMVAFLEAPAELLNAVAEGVEACRAWNRSVLERLERVQPPWGG